MSWVGDPNCCAATSECHREHVLDTLRLLMDMVELKTLGWVSQQFGWDWRREFIWRSSDEMSMVLNANSGAVLPQPLAQQFRDWLEMSATSSSGRMGT